MENAPLNRGAFGPTRRDAYPIMHRFLLARDLAAQQDVLLIGNAPPEGVALVAETSKSLTWVLPDSQEMQQIPGVRIIQTRSCTEWLLSENDEFGLVAGFGIGQVLTIDDNVEALFDAVRHRLRDRGQALLSFSGTPSFSEHLSSDIKGMRPDLAVRHILEKAFTNVRLLGQGTYSVSLMLPLEGRGSGGLSTFAVSNEQVDGTRDFNEYIHDELLAICTNGEVVGFPASVLFNPASPEFGRKELTATLFFSKSEHISEDASEKIHYQWRPGSRFLKTISLDAYPGCHTFRLDPVEERCVVRIRDIFLCDKEYQYFQGLSCRTNGTLVGDQFIFFDTSDPQIWLRLPEEVVGFEPHFLTIQIEILGLGDELAQYEKLNATKLDELSHELISAQAEAERSQKAHLDASKRLERAEAEVMELQSLLTRNQENLSDEARQVRQLQSLESLQDAPSGSNQGLNDQSKIAALLSELFQMVEELRKEGDLASKRTQADHQRIDGLHGELTQKRGEIEALRTDLEHQTHRVFNLEQQIIDKDRHIGNLENIRRHWEGRSAQLEETERHLRAVIAQKDGLLTRNNQQERILKMNHDYVAQQRNLLEEMLDEKEAIIQNLHSSFALKLARLVGNPMNLFRGEEQISGNSTAPNAVPIESMTNHTEAAPLPTISSQKRSLGSASGIAGPEISIVIPVYNSDLSYLRECIQSVFDQTSERWQLWVVNDGSTNEGIRPWLEATSLLDSRIHILNLPHNQHISEATNAGIAACQSDWVALLDHDDTLAPNALERMAEAINSHPEVQVLYSDQDKIDQQGRYIERYLKPGWSPEFLRNVMYIGHLLVFSREIWERTGGFDRYFDGVQDYEWMLRVSELTEAIVHIPEVLYHWRISQGSIADSPAAKSRMDDLQMLAVHRHLIRTGREAVVSQGNVPHRIRLFPLPNQPTPRVSVIIPTKDRPDLLGRCLEGLFLQTAYPNLEVLLVDNQTTDEEALALFSRYDCRVVPFERAFNYSAANNLGVQYANGEFLLFLNNDIEVTHPDWIQNMLYYAMQKDIGAVGALLTYPNEMVQHAGVVLGFRGTADHLMRGMPVVADGYYGTLHSAREVAAVTGACMMVSRVKFERAGGFRNEYAHIYQDIDLCLELRAAGYRNIYAPTAHLVHHESATRDASDYDSLDRALFLDRWGEVVEQGDPYYHPDFDLEGYGIHHAGYVLKKNEEA